MLDAKQIVKIMKAAQKARQAAYEHGLAAGLHATEPDSKRVAKAKRDDDHAWSVLVGTLDEQNT